MFLVMRFGTVFIVVNNVLSRNVPVLPTNFIVSGMTECHDKLLTNCLSRDLSDFIQTPLLKLNSSDASGSNYHEHFE